MNIKELRASIKPVYFALKEKAEYSMCSRCCNDSGYISAFSHIRGGVCFKCGGSGKKAANQAAKYAGKINSLYGSIAYSAKLGIEIEGLAAKKELDDLIDKIPKKYKTA